MSKPRSIIDKGTLESLEMDYRKRLEAEPDNTPIRSSLAWCLFMQALHQSGQEQLLSELCANEQVLDGISAESLMSYVDRTAHDTLQDCLGQVVAVIQLSPDMNQQNEASRIHQLIKISGGEHAVAQADEEASQLLRRIAHDMLSQTSCSPQPRRDVYRRSIKLGGRGRTKRSSRNRPSN